MDDREIARRALDFQKRAQEYRLLDVPGYREWSERKLDEGVSPALIAHLDATSMLRLPEDLDKVAPEDFDELLDDLADQLDGEDDED